MPLKVNRDAKQGEGRWFRYAADVEFKIRPLLATTIREMGRAAETGRQVMDQKTGKMVAEVDDKKLDDIVKDYLLEDWKGVEDEAGDPLPVSLDAKRALMDLVAIAEFVWQSARALDITEERVKN
jgi:hypothetical protein